MMHPSKTAAIRDAGTLTAQRQRAFAQLAVRLQEVERANDAAGSDDRCWELAGDFLALTEPATPSADTATGAVTDMDDETARKLAQLEAYAEQLTQALATGKMSAARAERGPASMLSSTLA